MEKILFNIAYGRKLNRSNGNPAKTLQREKNLNWKLYTVKYDK